MCLPLFVMQSLLIRANCLLQGQGVPAQNMFTKRPSQDDSQLGKYPQAERDERKEGKMGLKIHFIGRLLNNFRKLSNKFKVILNREKTILLRNCF